ncbi:NAD-glutamate dehydrogenase [Hirschia litorea]|uniref:NAD-glutamate dehydrogenase n=1 Tax=Hirschia litorea TaxID=1199156 RepID=A0ABW2ILC0_9PROT
MSFKTTNSSLAFAVDEILAAAENLSKGKTSEKKLNARNNFLKQFCNSASMEEFAPFSADDAAVNAMELWNYSLDADVSKRNIRSRPCVGANNKEFERTVFEIVGPDIPFLVDSAVSAIVEAGVEIVAIVHPVVDELSLIQIHTPPLIDSRRAEVEEILRLTFNDVSLATLDHMAMKKVMRDTAKSLLSMPVSEGRSKEDLEEANHFLTWLEEDHFFFLGARQYSYSNQSKVKNGEEAVLEPEIVGDGLGILRDVDRHVLSHGTEPAVLTPRIRSFLNEPSPIIVAKSNVRSRVHRRVYADYVGVKQIDKDGNVIGEIRFIGLFTAASYTRMAKDVPLIRRKIARVKEMLDMGSSSYSVNALNNILETYPRDDLFQISEDDLARFSYGILGLYQRPRTRLFIRRDQFNRFVSALLFTPRDNYSPELRRQAHTTIAEAYGGRESAFYPSFNDGPLARVHFIIGLSPGHAEPDEDALDIKVRQLAESWEDGLARSARLANDPPPLVHDNLFNAAYKEAFSPDEALKDLSLIHSIDDNQDVAVRAYPSAKHGSTRCKIYRRENILELSDIVPVLENMGLRVLSETGYPIISNPKGKERKTVWVHDLELNFPNAETVLDSKFEDGFVAVWNGQTENDRFNQLILHLNITWRQAALIRTLCRYRQQSGLEASQDVQIDALVNHPDITTELIKLFEERLDPSTGVENAVELAERTSAAGIISERIVHALEHVPSLDDDRVLRRTMHLINAIMRTNFYQVQENGLPYPHISIKIASQELEDLPAPKPFREIFMWSPQVEGVHLRFGPVARGGLRWSDRRDDFRTEVLGLVKAQQVKNAVIVPVGSKGGFFPKQLPTTGTREDYINGGIAAYKTFISSLLQLTDNIIDGVAKRPKGVFAWDGDDPYLVVAADKGTATFSDIANGLSQDSDFWLDDAFASGGSVGYDHKKMGITARGGWEAVKRHFREIGKDIQNEPFTAIGVGDMSGDVFGNGMLLSKQTKLLAAFNHMHIFVDPNPDPTTSFEERKRLFDMGRSSWSDYNADLISKGGRILSRADKSVEITPEIMEMTGLTEKSVTPGTLIRAILRMDAELLWFGGIGTYVKAQDEQNSQVGDKANDHLRLNGSELNVQIVGEGANLGMTQKGRIEFARKGGRLNTDAIDNSAGVDSSDHEVNIKILLKEAINAGELKAKDRNALLASMTDDVAKHVLVNNYDQTGALTIMEHSAVADLDAHAQFMSTLEAEGKLDRAVEFLPDTDAITAMKEQGLGLTRPELSVLLAYAKNDLFAAIVESDAPDDPAFQHFLKSYFPSALDKFDIPRANHRLKREIIATRLANRLVNMTGPFYPYEMRDASSVGIGTLVRASEAARSIFGLDELINRINALDNKAPTQAQTLMRVEIAGTLRQLTGGLVPPILHGADLTELIAMYADGVSTLRVALDSCITPFVKERIRARADTFVAAGAPEDIALDVASIRILATAREAVDVSLKTGWPVTPTARIQHALDEIMALDKMRAAVRDIQLEDHWERLAMQRVSDALPAQQAALSELAINHAKKDGHKPEKLTLKAAHEAVEMWLAPMRVDVNRVTGPIDQFETSGSWTLAKLVLVGDALREFVQNSVQKV